MNIPEPGWEQQPVFWLFEGGLGTHIADLFLRLLQSQELRCVRNLAVSFAFILLKFLLVVNLQ